MDKQRWLVTGASGQLGGHLLRQLARGTEPDDLLGLTRAPGDLASGVRAVSADLDDPDALRHAITEFRPSQILHLGAMTSLNDCYAQPEAARRVNVTATRVLAQAAAECGGRLVYASTDMVTPTVASIPTAAMPMP